MTAGWPATPREDGLELALKVTAKADRTAITGLTVDAAGTSWLAAKVTAAPESGRANDAVLALLAQQLAVPRSSCRLIAGATSRWKRVLVGGDAGELARRVAALTQSDA